MARILLSVEDDDAVYRLLQIAFHDLDLDFYLHRVGDGAQALEFLRKEGRFADAPTPNLVLLNLNLPRLNGRDVLAQMKTDPLLRDIPTVVFSSSSMDEERAHCLALGAKNFLTKPLDFDGFIAAVRTACSHASA